MGGKKVQKKKKMSEYAEVASNLPDNEPTEFNSPAAKKEIEAMSPKKS